MKRDAQQLLTIAQSQPQVTTVLKSARSSDQAVQRIAGAQADAVARVRAAKRARRLQEHRRRLAQTDEPSPAAWLAAVALDDRREERELVTEEQPA